MARLWKAPAAMAVRAAPAGRGGGVGRKASVGPTPGWASLLRPHATPVLSDLLIARLWAAPQAIAAAAAAPGEVRARSKAQPAAIWVTVPGTATATGVELPVVVPLPSWPKAL